uniref:Uncharacterized protein n=1 Tax=Strigops habroptila TaxID=2489341 RepID=A0A672TY71_STRHB
LCSVIISPPLSHDHLLSYRAVVQKERGRREEALAICREVSPAVRVHLLFLSQSCCSLCLRGARSAVAAAMGILSVQMCFRVTSHC